MLHNDSDVIVSAILRLHHDQRTESGDRLRWGYRESSTKSVAAQEQARFRLYQSLRSDSPCLLRILCVSRRSHSSREGDQGLEAEQKLQLIESMNPRWEDLARDWQDMFKPSSAVDREIPHSA
jgi:hypothetical protein